MTENLIPIMRRNTSPPTWTDDPVKDDMRYQVWLEESQEYKEDDDYNPWEEYDE